MKRKIRNFLIHFLLWAVFLSLPVFLDPHPFDPGFLIHDFKLLHDYIAYIFMIPFFYLNYYVLIPRFYFTKKYLWFVALLILSFLFITALPGMVIMDPGPPPQFPGKPMNFFPLYVNQVLFKFLVVFLVSFFLQINEKWRKAEHEKLNAQIAYLKAQINPHFLFNALNSIYSLSIAKSDKTPQAVVILADMMRYVIYEAPSDTVPLEKEIKYISDYLMMQKIRLGETIKLDYDIAGKTRSCQIAPFLLIPFVENAFKHGVNPEENSVITVRIDVVDGLITLFVYNRKVRKIARIEPQSGLGVETTVNRLKLLYGGRYELDIVDNMDDFTVNLQLQLS